jgi:catechol 2,3-dioxygenase-like lactoylglutathione lyase family enzyme
MIECAVSHIGLCVSNLQRSRAFYEGVLGFEYVREIKNKDSDVQDRFLQVKGVDLHAVFFRKGGLTLELLSYASPGTTGSARKPMNQPGFTHLSLTIEDMPKALASITAAGGTVLDTTLINGVACFVLDPDGNRVELVTSAASRRAAQAHH